MTMAKGLTRTARRDLMAAWTAQLQDEITTFFERLDGGHFSEAAWDRQGGGGGRSRLLSDGAVFEKAGVNATPYFFATGVSVVVHPRSPMVPTVHLNVRYFELTDADGQLHDAWYGGGTDLTPMHPFPEDARHFHRSLKWACDAHDPRLYPAHKAWCDEYFRNLHRANEARGVGGVFFDHLRPSEAPFRFSPEALHAYVTTVGRSLDDAYGPIVHSRRDLPYTERDKALQLYRRGRYVEFNLVHDRGTIFGLQTGARTESVLMSLPPLAAWAPYHEPAQGSIEAELAAMLAPRDWAGED
jgi:coproporphyrinogen III oxidase